MKNLPRILIQSGFLLFLVANAAFAVTPTKSYQLNSKILKEETKFYNIEIKYPQMEGYAKKDVEDKFNAYGKGVFSKDLAEFKKSMKDIPTTGLPSSMSEVKSDFIVEYAVSQATDSVVSFMFDVSTYSAGAAHPNHFAMAANFDMTQGRPISLGDLFQPNSKYLQALSQYCVTTLMAKANSAIPFEEDWVRKGAGPQGENFKNFNLTPQGLLIEFDPYQVAPYAAGPQRVTIPYSQLKTIINPAGPLAVYVK